MHRFGLASSSDIPATPGSRPERGERTRRRLVVQGGCMQLDVAVHNDDAEHLERCGCRGAPPSQPH